MLVERPLVSVTMVTYNHDRFIAQAIEGVLMQQTDFPIELVIAEDCSTDSTRAICEEYHQKFPKRHISLHKSLDRLCDQALDTFRHLIDQSLPDRQCPCLNRGQHLS